MTAMILVQFCKLADVAEIVSPIAVCFKMIIVNVTASHLPGFSAPCGISNLVTIFDPKQLFVVRVNKADSFLCVFQVPIKPVPAITVAVQIVFALLGVEAKHVGVFICIGSESQLPAIGTWFLTVRVLIAVRCEHCSVSKDYLVLGL